MSWNGCPISKKNFLIRKLKTKYENYSASNSNADSQTYENSENFDENTLSWKPRREHKILHIENSTISNKAGQIHNYL